MTCTGAVWKDFQTLFRTMAGGPTLYEGRARARARARALSTRRFSRVSYIYCNANYWSCPRVVVAKITVVVLTYGSTSGPNYQNLRGFLVSNNYKKKI